MRREHRNNTSTTTAAGLHHTGTLNNWVWWFVTLLRS